MFFKGSGQFLIKYNDTEAFSKQLMVLIARWLSQNIDKIEKKIH